MADGINTFDIADFVDVPYLTDSVLHESSRDGFWTKLLRVNYVEALGREEVPPIGNLDKGKVTFSGAPIEQFGEFEQGGLDEIRVPIKMQYRGDPRSGRVQLQGTGEGVDFMARTIPIWNLKKAFNLVVPHTVDGQALKKFLESAINDEVRPAAAKWLRDWTEGDIMHTILTGFSSNLTSLRGISGYRTDQTPYSHPNIFIAGHGRLVHGTSSDQRPQGEGYEERLVGALNTMMATNPSETGLTPERLIAFRNDLHRLKIPRIKTPAGEFYGLVVKDSAYSQLELNKELFRNDIIQSLPRDLRSNPFFGDVVAVFGQFIIYTYPDLFGVQIDGSNKVITHSSSSIGMPAYGPSASWIQRSGLEMVTSDQSDCAICYAFGAGFMSQVYGKVRMKWTIEQWDHEQNKEIGMHLWSSLVRNDVLDVYNKYSYGTNAVAYNDSSALLFVHAPYVGSY